MRILRVRVSGMDLYQDSCFDLGLFALDRVTCAAGLELPEDVCRVGESGSIYSLNAVGLSGVNASGKSATLMLLSVVMHCVLQPIEAYFGPHEQAISTDFFDDRGSLSFEVVFWHDGLFYLLQSETDLAGEVSDDSGNDDCLLPAGFRFNDEWLWRVPSSYVSRRLLASSDEFVSRGSLLIHRSAASTEQGGLTAAEHKGLASNISIVSLLLGEEPACLPRVVSNPPEEHLAQEVVQAFDPNVECLQWDADIDGYRLKFRNGPLQCVDEDYALSVLSCGTVQGAYLVMHAMHLLTNGGCLLVDEIESHLNRTLVGTIVGLFTSPATNPHGAQLVFTTHTPEILDLLHRKDSVYVLVRNEEYRTEIVRYSDRVKRIENKKSEAILSNVVKGSLPRYSCVRNLREYVRARVNE